MYVVRFVFCCLVVRLFSRQQGCTGAPLVFSQRVTSALKEIRANIDRARAGGARSACVRAHLFGVHRGA